MASGDLKARTRPLLALSAGALSAGRVVGIDGSGTVDYADTDTAIVGLGILANDCSAAGEACSIYTPGDLVKCTVLANTTINQALGLGVAADSGKLKIVAAGSGGSQVFAIATESISAGESGYCRIVEYLMAEDVP